MESSRAAALRALVRGSRDDRGDIVLGWLTRLVVFFALAGIALFDAISIGTTVVNVSDQGSYAAREASEAWLSTSSLQKAYDAAVLAATEQNAANTIDPKSFHVDPDGTVHLHIARTATTLVIYRISKIAHWADVDREASGRSVA